MKLKQTNGRIGRAALPFHGARGLAGMAVMAGVVGVAGVVGLVALSASAAHQAQPHHPTVEPVSPPVLRVTGSGSTFIAPDRALVRVGATFQAREAAEAQRQVNDVMSRAIDDLTRLDIDRQQIQTSRLNLWPVYADQRPPRPPQARPGEEPQEPRIVGYRASMQITVRLSDLEKVGQVIDTSLEAGLNELGGVSFELSDEAAAKSEALAEAVSQARSKGEAIARAMGKGLGDLVEVSEGFHDPIRPMAIAARAGMEMATPVEPGELEVRAQVTVTWQLRTGE